MQHAKKYAVNTTWLLIEKSARIISGLFIGILVARYLGPEQFGMLGYALNIVAVFAILNTLGLEGILVRELIERKEQTDSIVSSALLLRLLTSSLAMGIIWVYSSMRDSPEQVWIVMIVAVYMLFQSFTVIDLYFNSVVKGRYNAISQVATLCISAVIKLAMIALGMPLAYFAAMLALESMISMFIQLYFYHKEGKRLKLLKANLVMLKSLAVQAFPFVVAGFIYYVFLKMDIILLKRFWGLYEVGNYNAALRISEAFYFIVIAISSAVFPAMVNNKGTDLFEQRFTQLVSVLIYISLFIMVGSLLMGGSIISFLYKSKFADAPQLFTIHILTLLPVYLNTIWGFWILSESKQIVMIALFAVVLVVSLSIQLYLIPIYAATGAAWGYVVSQYICIILAFTIYKPKFMWRIAIHALNPKRAIEAISYIRGK
jgi:O-antigen/teichoic acid export membrane protein